VLSVIRVAGYDEAVTALNQTRYGLSSSIFTRDNRTAFRAMREERRNANQEERQEQANGDQDVV